MEDSSPFSVIIFPSQRETMWQCRTLAGFLSPAEGEGFIYK